MTDSPMLRLLATFLLILGACSSPTSPRPKAVLREAWTLARDEFFDPQMNGLDWDAALALVDETARSGKEILAYGFRKYDLGPVVGARTAGAVVGGRPDLLADGSLLFLAVQDARVDGARLEGVGVTPDIEVPRDLPYSAGVDPQLERALEVVAGLAGS